MSVVESESDEEVDVKESQAIQQKMNGVGVRLIDEI